MTPYTVDVDQLADLQSQMKNFLTLATQRHADVGAVAESIRSSWDSDAAQSFDRRYREWGEALRDMNTVLDDLSLWVSEAETIYRDVMARNVRLATGD